MTPSSTVAVVLTGGTVGQRTEAHGSVPDRGMTADLVSRHAPAGVEVRRIQAMERNSPDVSPRDWSVLAETVAGALRDGADGVVVLHGTDTLAYTAAALSFALAGIDRPVAITGSMVPGNDPGSDAGDNLSSAFAVAGSANAGVFVVFGSAADGVQADVLPATRVLKVRTADRAAFRAVGSDPLGRVVGGRAAFVTAPPSPPPWSPPPTTARFAEDVDLIKVTPLLTPDRLRRMLQGLRGVVVEGFGAGHVSRGQAEVLASFAGPVVVSTQVLGDAERLGSYASDRMLTDLPNVVGAGPMTSVAALVKLSWALGQGLSVRETMAADVAGELGADSTRR